MFFTLADTTFIPMDVMYLHARMFCTLSHTSFIPMSAMYLYMLECFFTLAETILYPLRAPIFTMRTKVWPCANHAVVTNILTMTIKVVLIEGFL